MNSSFSISFSLIFNLNPSVSSKIYKSSFKKILPEFAKIKLSVSVLKLINISLKVVSVFLKSKTVSWFTSKKLDKISFSKFIVFLIWNSFCLYLS